MIKEKRLAAGHWPVFWISCTMTASNFPLLVRDYSFLVSCWLLLGGHQLMSRPVGLGPKLVISWCFMSLLSECIVDVGKKTGGFFHWNFSQIFKLNSLCLSVEWSLKVLAYMLFCWACNFMCVRASTSELERRGAAGGFCITVYVSLIIREEPKVFIFYIALWSSKRSCN